MMPKTISVQKYVVGRKKFDTMDLAVAYANNYYSVTGIVLAIELKTVRVRNNGGIK